MVEFDLEKVSFLERTQDQVRTGQIMIEEIGNRLETERFAGAPFLFDGDFDGRLQPMDRVVTIEVEGDVVAYPFSLLEQNLVAKDEVGGKPVAVFFKPGTASALDLRSISESRDIGAATTFSPVVDGQQLTFSTIDGVFQDAETGSTWNSFGRGVSGPMEGTELTPVVSGNHFWFAWAAFKPETRIWDGA